VHQVQLAALLRLPRLRQVEQERRKAAGAGGAAAGDGDTIKDRLQKAFLQQCDEYEAEMRAHEAEDKAAGKPSRYGKPDARGNVERYGYWPAKHEKWDLVYIPAATHLCTHWTPMNLERTNSVAGIICNRLRASMSPETLKRLVLGRVWLKDASFVGKLGAPAVSDPVALQEWAEDITVDKYE